MIKLNELEYRLKLDNHNISRDIARTIEESFPNFEIFWSKYLVPLTGVPRDTSWRIDTFPNLEEIGMSHFGILKSLNFIRISISDINVGDPKQTFKNIYFHFGLIFDSVETLARNIIVVEDCLGIIKIEERSKLSKTELITEFTKWVDEKYPSHYNKMITSGKPIFYYPQHDHNFLKILIPKKSKRKKYSKFSVDIKNYRNFFIHNPGVDISMNYSTGELSAIKKKYIERCKLWSEFRLLVLTKQNYFDNPKLIAHNDFFKVLEILNNLWEFLVKEMEIIYSHENFQTIFTGYERIDLSPK